MCRRAEQWTDQDADTDEPVEVRKFVGDLVTGSVEKSDSYRSDDDCIVQPCKLRCERLRQRIPDVQHAQLTALCRY